MNKNKRRNPKSLNRVGIYFVNQSSSEHTQADDSNIVTNNPSELIFVIPATTAKTYSTEGITQYADGGRPLINTRTGRFNRILAVQ
jgi:hypothetical protein